MQENEKHLPQNVSDALPQLARIFKIITVLKSRASHERIGRSELMEICECSRSTIQRDINFLQMNGIPIDYHNGLHSYVLDTNWKFPVIDWDIEDVMALAFAQSLLVSPALPHSSQIQKALNKATSLLTPELRKLIELSSEVLRSDTMIRDYSHAPVSQLTSAALTHTTVEIDYASNSGKSRSWRRVDPYRVEKYEDYFQLNAWCHKNNEIRDFALDRVYEVHITDDHFVRNEEAWKKYTSAPSVVGGIRGGAIISVCVRFLPVVADYALSRQWPASLQISQNDDGSALLTGEVQGTDGMVAKLLFWKRHVEVLGGPELRQAMMNEVNAISDLYEPENNIAS